MASNTRNTHHNQHRTRSPSAKPHKVPPPSSDFDCVRNTLPAVQKIILRLSKDNFLDSQYIECALCLMLTNLKTLSMFFQCCVLLSIMGASVKKHLFPSFIFLFPHPRFLFRCAVGLWPNLLRDGFLFLCPNY